MLNKFKNDFMQNVRKELNYEEIPLNQKDVLNFENQIRKYLTDTPSFLS